MDFNIKKWFIGNVLYWLMIVVDIDFIEMSMFIVVKYFRLGGIEEYEFINICSII